MSDLRSVLSGLSAARLRVTFHVETPLDLPPFAGFPLYGALKEHMARLACEQSEQANCGGRCSKPSSCTYGHLFETAADPMRSDGGRFKDAPKPFVLQLLEPERTTWKKGDRLQFNLVLFGPRAAKAASGLAAALNAIETAGLGVRDNERGLVKLAAVEHLEPDGTTHPLQADQRLPLYPLASLITDEHPENRLALRFETPLRLRKHGRWLNEDDLGLADITTALLRRLDLLARFHGPSPLDLNTEPFLQAARGAIVVQRQLRWIRQERRSTRHTKHIPMDGVTGHLPLENVPPILADLLATGSLINLGSKTTQGLGQMSLVPVS